MSWCCCSEFVEIGCENYCDNIDIGYIAIQNGAHFAEIYINNSTVKSIELSAVIIGDNFIIPSGTLNESKTHDLRILQPDGTYFIFATDIQCAKLTTLVYV